MSKEFPWGKGTPTWVLDAALNDSDKTYTVPPGKAWVFDYIHAELTCSATVGNRVLGVDVSNGAATLFASPRLGSMAASTNGVVEMYPGATYTSTAAQVPRLSGATPNGAIRSPSPSLCQGLVLSAGYTIRVYDSAAIDAAADDMTVVLHYIEYDA